MIKKIVSLLSSIIIFSFQINYGQEFHTPAEILKIMEESPLAFELKTLETKIPAPDRSKKLNYNLFYQAKDKDGNIDYYEYEISKKTEEILNQAESFFMAKEYTKAREKYIEAYQSDPKYYGDLTYIGQTYGLERDFDKAIEWYNKTISLNYIDYMAHWFLADAYSYKGNIDKAVEEITIALILNRNNPRIQKAYDDIYKQKKMKPLDWSFTPQVKIDSLGKDKVGVSYEKDWLGYALYKAVWDYEPGYAKSKGETRGEFSMFKEKECFIGLLTPLEKKTINANPEFKALQASLDNKMVEEFILFEVLLPEYPHAVMRFPEQLINDIKKYVILVRGQAK